MSDELVGLTSCACCGANEDIAMQLNNALLSNDSACEEINRLSTEIESLREQLRVAREALLNIRQWADAYPISVFPEPDFEKAHEVLKAAGMTLDAISASNMRHVINQTRTIVDDALAPPISSTEG